MSKITKVDYTHMNFGPFVMNSKKELVDAFVDFQEGRMGNLVFDN